MAERDPNFGNSEVFVLDEFLGLPAGHAARCDVMMATDFVDLLDEPPIVNAMDPAATDLDAEAARYAHDIGSVVVDLTMLGLGMNGHVALNEPGSTEKDGARVVDLHPSTIASMDADPVPTQGITLGLSDILASKEVWLLVTGAAKAEMLASALEGPIGPEVPASYLREHPNAVVFADEPAAGQLTVQR